MRKLLATLILAGSIAYFVWPTRYKEYEPNQGPFAEEIGNRPSRVDRLTGDVWVRQASGEWKKHHVRRPELQRPDITGPQPNTRADTRPAQQQMRDQADMNSRANEMMESAVEEAKKE